MLEAAVLRLQHAGIDSPRFDAELLLARALKISRSALLLRKNEETPKLETKKFETLLVRRESREPLQWILGDTEFYGLEIFTEPGVLIPRPETESLVELALKEIKEDSQLRLLDIGTGTSAIALAIKHARPNTQVFATDINQDAIRLAKKNAAQLNLEIFFEHGDLAASFSGPFDVIVSNPPYLPTSDAQYFSKEVLAEPTNALLSGQDGLDVAKQIVELATHSLVGGGLLALELDPRNVHVLAGALNKNIWHSIQIEKDLLGRERFLLARMG